MIHWALLISLGLAPSLLWLGFILRQDIHKEKKIDLAKVFLLGILTAIPVLAFALLFQDAIRFFDLSIQDSFNIFVSGALIEELLKGYVLYRYAMPQGFFDEPIDLLIYASTIALGFAAIENIFLIFSSLELGSNLITLILFRSVTAVVIHIVSTFYVGYFIYKVVKQNQSHFMLLGCLIGIAIHGLYNLSVSSGNIDILTNFCLYVLIPSIALILYLIKGLKRQSE